MENEIIALCKKMYIGELLDCFVMTEIKPVAHLKGCKHSFIKGCKVE